MFQNIKVDIIYYKTATDFEMEFNLSGCCRMRLLTDKAPDRKVLVNQLVRAVSRSRIIIMTGALFGEEGVITTCSKAISRPLVKVNNGQFGINSDDSIEIIENAIPLVSSDGIFGGCIIEQGPQTLILLSENKNIRKNIMQTLIHPYVKEVCAGELTEKAPEAAAPETEINSPEEPVLEELVEEQPTEIEETAEATEEITEEISQEAEDVETEDGDENALEAQLITNQLIEDSAEKLPLVVDNYDNDDFDDVSSYSDEEYFTEKDNKKTKGAVGLNSTIIIISVILLIAVAILCYALFIVPKNAGMSAVEYLKETYEILFA